MSQRSTHDLPAAERLNQENEASAMQSAGFARLSNWQGFTLQSCRVGPWMLVLWLFEVKCVFTPRPPRKTVTLCKTVLSNIKGYIWYMFLWPVCAPEQLQPQWPPPQHCWTCWCFCFILGHDSARVHSECQTPQLYVVPRNQKTLPLVS